MAPTRLPSKFIMGTFKYRIKRKGFWKAKNDLRDGTIGFCDVESLEIGIKPGLAVAVERESIFHEVMHAAFAAAGQPDITGEDGEEAFITGTSHMLLMVLRDNPKLTDYLLAP